jgi:hypothetical protein
VQRGVRSLHGLFDSRRGWVQVQCGGTRVIDEVGFVRGNLGIQVIDWYAMAGDRHRTVEVLAERAAAPYTSPPPTTKFAPVPPG